ncbi:hypothetical protein GCM10011571_32430 [Marinithermofilum abyssi]|uniref:L,D-TPase catalytic domain-containing protein n=1 Tax=Marinithermofilum abyssi TaxID=1571185 RepID=A0A8J2YE89_9BACL|nr:L,D-transpeptidase family protein [Marinithermofilum abyssi]GGE27772.1 hypothetical protein GCM10011571_32430 [Marinithermofilum abyssi]
MKKSVVGLSLFFLCITSLISRSIAVEVADAPKEIWVKIDLWKRRLFLMEGSKVVQSFPVAAGKENFPTPIGNWKVTEKSREWGGGFGTRWLGLNVPWGTYGIHGTNQPNSIGHDTSHGCIRMLNSDIERLFERTPVGVTVRIEGPIFGREEWRMKKLVRGDRGTLVMLVQNRLQAAGYYSGPVDGIFGQALERTVKRYQRDHRLLVTGQIQLPEYIHLGLLE